MLHKASLPQNKAQPSERETRAPSVSAHHIGSFKGVLSPHFLVLQNSYLDSLYGQKDVSVAFQSRGFIPLCQTVSWSGIVQWILIVLASCNVPKFLSFYNKECESISSELQTGLLLPVQPSGVMLHYTWRLDILMCLKINRHSSLVCLQLICYLKVEATPTL